MARAQALLAVLLALAANRAASAAEIAVRDADGLVRVNLPKVEAKFQNPAWPADAEKAFWKRAQVFMAAFEGETTASTSGEHEKWTYPKQMLNYLIGGKAAAIRAFEAEDVDGGDHKHTLGIDWYWSFTIKGQVRKYFLFGDLLKPEYKKRMYDAAKLWTAEDPRPNFELVLLLDSRDRDVAGYALEALQKSKKQLEEAMQGEEGDKLRAWAKTAPAERAKAIAAIDEIVRKYKGQEFGGDVAKWRAWWKDFADHDWMVLEEAERVMNIRPHPTHGRGRPGAIGADFSPASRGYWVDGRNTDNLRAMRETSVYLMAEETGNEVTRKVYKEKIKRFVYTSYTIGMGEWDSENYLSHTTMPYHSLYDFAKDPEVKLLAKAFLDWVYSANAMKYYRGGFGGPTKRDYGGANRVFGSEPGVLMWLWAGDAPISPKGDREDVVHAITSAYRPPLAVVGLARKEFKKPVEMWDTKPTYSNWFPGADAKPEFWETMYYGESFYLGTCVSEGGAGDVGAFKLLAYNAKRGVDYFLANSGRKTNSKNSGDQIGQYGNLCVFLSGKGGSFVFQLPETAKQTNDAGVWYVELEKTWLAIRPINLGEVSRSGSAAAGKDKAPGDPMYAAKGGGGLCGIALEIGEAPAFRDFAAFKDAVKGKSKLEVALNDGRVKLSGADGRVLEMTYNKTSDMPILVRDGKRREWEKETAMYQPVDGSNAPMSLGWKTGKLRVEAGGHLLEQSVDAEGKVSFTVR